MPNSAASMGVMNPAAMNAGASLSPYERQIATTVSIVTLLVPLSWRFKVDCPMFALIASARMAFSPVTLS
jgi:hypothetical protein